MQQEFLVCQDISTASHPPRLLHQGFFLIDRIALCNTEFCSNSRIMAVIDKSKKRKGKSELLFAHAQLLTYESGAGRRDSRQKGKED